MPLPNITSILFLSLFTGVILYKNRNHWKLILGLIIGKLVGLLVLVWIYSVYYPNRSEADIFKFHSDVVLLREAVNKDQVKLYDVIFGKNLGESQMEQFEDLQVWDRSYNHTILNENRSYLKLYLLLSYLSGSNFWTLSVLMMFLSIFGQLLMYKALDLKLDLKLLILSSLPSFLIWNNGLLKEAMILFLLGALTFSVFKNKKLLCLVLPLMVLFKISLGVLAILLFPLILIVKTQFKLLYLFFGYLAIMFLHYILPDWSPFGMLQNIQRDFIHFSTEISSGSLMPVPRLENPILIPYYFIIGIFHSFFAPFPYLYNGLVNKGVILENVLVALFLAFAIFRFKKKKPVIGTEMFYLIVLVFVYLCVLGATTPVAGSLVRYKAPFVFTLMMLVVKILFQDSFWQDLWKKRSFTK